MSYYDRVQRVVLTRLREKRTMTVRRLRCVDCGRTHREIPNDIFPRKHYEAKLIWGVLDGLITCETFGYEDYPCEATMTRWILAYFREAMET